MTNSLGCGPPWLSMRHREVDVGRTFSSTTGIGPPTHRNLFTRTTIRSGGPKVWEDPKRTFGRYEGCERARESIARLVVITSNLPKVHVNAKATLGRCNTGRRRATRSCASDAEHEFSRTRCPGRYPMLSFRDPRGPQLLLMQSSLLRRREVGDRNRESVFMIAKMQDRDCPTNLPSSLIGKVRAMLNICAKGASASGGEQRISNNEGCWSISNRTRGEPRSGFLTG